MQHHCQCTYLPHYSGPPNKSKVSTTTRKLINYSNSGSSRMMAASSALTLPSDVEDEDCVEDYDGIALPSDDDPGAAQDVATLCKRSYSQGVKKSIGKQSAGTKKRKFKTYPGVSRHVLMNDKAGIIQPRDPVLWNVDPLQHMPVDHDDAMEIFSPPRVANKVQELGLRCSISADLETGWDLGMHYMRQSLVAHVKAFKPRVMILSPPCTFFSCVMASNWYRMEKLSRENAFLQALQFLEFCCLLMDMQISDGRHVIFEHPWRAMSWQHPAIIALSKRDGMKKIRFDMCMFGMVSPVEKVPLQKPTVFMTTLGTLVPKLDKMTCRGAHSRHKTIEGMEGNIKLSRWAQRYPDLLCEAIAEAISEL